MEANYKYGNYARKMLANNIVYYRLKKGWTQEELADKLGTTPNYISNIENAKRNVRIDYIGFIANIFDIPLEQLFIERQLVVCHRMPKR